MEEKEYSQTVESKKPDELTSTQDRALKFIGVVGAGILLFFAIGVPILVWLAITLLSATEQ